MIEILHRLCRVCDACVAVCPTLALWTMGDRLTWAADRCRDEGHCIAVCPAGALRRAPGTPPAAAAEPAGDV